MSRTPEELLAEALWHFDQALAYARGDLSEQIVIDAVCMRLAAGIETLKRLPDSEIDDLFGDEWPLMWGLRNRIAHGYALVNPAVIGRTMKDEMPSVVAAVRERLGRSNP